MASIAHIATPDGATHDLKVPNALTLTPVDASGTAGSAVAFDGSAVQSLSVITEHQDISGKLDSPSGGEAGNVLKKTANGVGWAENTPLSGQTYDFENGENMTEVMYNILTSVITKLGGSVKNPITFQ